MARFTWVNSDGYQVIKSARSYQISCSFVYSWGWGLGEGLPAALTLPHPVRKGQETAYRMKHERQRRFNYSPLSPYLPLWNSLVALSLILGTQGTGRHLSQFRADIETVSPKITASVHDSRFPYRSRCYKEIKIVGQPPTCPCEIFGHGPQCI